VPRSRCSLRVYRRPGRHQVISPLAGACPLVSGVLLAVPDDDVATLVPLLAALQ
jgi:hypothetical protein